MPNELVGAGFSLAAAVFWGAADFSGGVGAKNANSAHVVAFSQAAGLFCLLALALGTGEALPSSDAVMWGVAAGVGAGIGNLCFYRALAIGQMGINAPIAAIVTCALTVFLAIWQDGMPAPLQILGFALALIAIWLMTVSEGKTAGLTLAILGGLGFCVYLSCSKQATMHSAYWPLVTARVAAITTAIAVALATGRIRSAVTKVSFTIAAGIFDAVANALFVYAVRNGRLDVATILSGFYPGITVLCARLILDERVSWRQNVGIITALIAIPLIATH